MKQHITVKQLQELSKKACMRLNNWYYDKRKKGDLVIYFHPINGNLDPQIFGVSAMQGDPAPLLSIGRMIEFLQDYSLNFWIYYDRNPDLFTLTLGKNPYPKDLSLEKQSPELCDLLWDQVKNELEKE